ncbi:MAG: hypothetical protein HYY01_06640 [Chloroflexi bacterium]|nr:hypothetical protein [Chloroflexota bacterium]
MTRISKEDVKTLVAMVGREGAIAALDSSKRINTQELAQTASSLGVKATTKDTKSKIAAQIVKEVDRRIAKSLDELKAMSKDEIIQYFDQVECDEEEVVDLLRDIDLKSRAKSRRDLLEFAAVQICSLGIFERLADRRG